MSPQKISRAQWSQIESRIKKVNGVFDPKWKCLIDGADWRRGSCAHTADDQHDIIEQVKARA